ncbi:hypothetical protein QYF61_006892 [Mycteria americana]|uniref:Uncharacterized protein n=1 Tax=Mycteria americana TaxID=33587 RepID=A0AAN7MS52_MYCAM|nr:hypothetical protein QYF61_006892 [Mycteria americana]
MPGLAAALAMAVPTPSHSQSPTAPHCPTCTTNAAAAGNRAEPSMAHGRESKDSHYRTRNIISLRLHLKTLSQWVKQADKGHKQEQGVEDCYDYRVDQHKLRNSFSATPCLAQASSYLRALGKQGTAGSLRLAFASTTYLSVYGTRGNQRQQDPEYSLQEHSALLTPSNGRWKAPSEASHMDEGLDRRINGEAWPPANPSGERWEACFPNPWPGHGACKAERENGTLKKEGTPSFCSDTTQPHVLVVGGQSIPHSQEALQCPEGCRFISWLLHSCLVLHTLGQPSIHQHSWESSSLGLSAVRSTADKARFKNSHRRFNGLVTLESLAFVAISKQVQPSPAAADFQRSSVHFIAGSKNKNQKRDGDSTTSLGSLFQRWTTLSVKRDQPHLSTASFQAVVESDEVSPQPPFLQAEQPQVPQPLPISLVLQTLPQLHCPSLDTLQPLNVSLVVRGPTLNTAFEVRPHQCPVQGHDHCPTTAGHTISGTSQDAIGFLGHLGTLLAHIQVAVNEHPQVLLCQAAFQPLFPKPVALHGVAVAQIQPVQVPLQSLPPLKQINTPAQLGVICKLAEGALDPLFQITHKDIKQGWPQHRALGDTTCDQLPTGFNSIHHHSLGPAIQPVLYPAKSTPVQAMSSQFLQENAVGNLEEVFHTKMTLSKESPLHRDLSRVREQQGPAVPYRMRSQGG